MTIYAIANKTTPDALPRLVRAPNRAQALRHVASDFAVEQASQEELVRLLNGGQTVEDARDAGEEAKDDPA